MRPPAPPFSSHRLEAGLPVITAVSSVCGMKADMAEGLSVETGVTRGRFLRLEGPCELVSRPLRQKTEETSTVGAGASDHGTGEPW